MDWIKKNMLTIGVMLCTGGIAWGSVTARIDGIAQDQAYDRAQSAQTLADVHAETREIRADVKDIRQYLMGERHR